MAIRWSSIHEQLGETPRDLDFALLRAAVDANVTETESLDWKEELPAKGKDPAREFAKDVAAMANTRGGLIVYGVKEDGTAAAQAFNSVNNSDDAQRRLRQLAVNNVHPMVPGLEFLPLTSDDGTDRVLVLVVPRSPDAPHVIGVEDRLGLPFRNGTATVWMREREIERAYADRFAGRRAETRRLTEMVDETAAMLDLRQSAWLVGVSRPRTALPAVAAPLAKEDVRTVLEAVLRRTTEILPAAHSDRFTLVRDLDSNVLNPRVGLRRWIIRIPTSHAADVLSMFVHVELHHDGSIVFAAQADGWGGGEPKMDHYNVLCPLVESFAVDFAALAEAYALRLGGQISMAYRCDLLKAEDLPFQALDLRRLGSGHATGKYEPVRGSWMIHRFLPIAGEIPIGAERSDLHSAAQVIALDVVNQFGVPRLYLLR